MYVLFLPTNELATARAAAEEVRKKGYQANFLPSLSVAEYLAELSKATEVVVMGILDNMTVWAWGYATGRKKKVTAIKGVMPCYTKNTVELNKWLEKIPKQLTLFPENFDAENKTTP